MFAANHIFPCISALLSLACYVSDQPELYSAAVTRQRVSISSRTKDFPALHSAWAGCKPAALPNRNKRCALCVERSSLYLMPKLMVLLYIHICIYIYIYIYSTYVVMVYYLIKNRESFTFYLTLIPAESRTRNTRG